MTTLVPEVTASGLLLWRLRRAADQQLWCAVRQAAAQGSLVLTVHDTASGQTVVDETHADIVPLVERAEAMRDVLVAAGWQLIDVDVHALH